MKLILKAAILLLTLIAGPLMNAIAADTVGLPPANAKNVEIKFEPVKPGSDGLNFLSVWWTISKKDGAISDWVNFHAWFGGKTLQSMGQSAELKTFDWSWSRNDGTALSPAQKKWEAYATKLRKQYDLLAEGELYVKKGGSKFVGVSERITDSTYTKYLVFADGKDLLVVKGDDWMGGAVPAKNSTVLLATDNTTYMTALNVNGRYYVDGEVLASWADKKNTVNRIAGK